MYRRLIYLLLLLPSLAFAQTQDVITFPDNARFLSRVIVERRTTDRATSSLGRGAIWFDDVAKTWKGDTGTAIVTFQNLTSTIHNILSVTHNDTSAGSPGDGAVLKYRSAVSKWEFAALSSTSGIIDIISTTNALSITFRPGLGTANQIVGTNSLANAYENKTLSGTTNQVTVTHAAKLITLSTPQDINTTSSPTFAALTLTAALTVANGGTGAATFTTNGVLYGNGTSAVQVTAAGGANCIFWANSGAPSCTSSPNIGTQLTLSGSGSTFLMTNANTQLLMGGSISNPGWTIAAIQNNNNGALWGLSGQLIFSQNLYNDGTTKHIATGTAARFSLQSLNTDYSTSASVSAGVAATLISQITFGLGVQIGTPTGNAQGNGTLNVAVNYYANGTAALIGPVTCTTVTSITVKFGLITAIAGAGC